MPSVDPSKIYLMLDSGAYSAWNKGSRIDLTSYIKFAKENQDAFDVIVNLDVIPGKPGQRYMDEDRERAAQQGWQNYMAMLESGIPPEKLMHVFHQGEDTIWLSKLLATFPNFVGISPDNAVSTPVRQSWLDGLMPFLCDHEGCPRFKFHGFGVTSVHLIVRYPWWSVDSTSWMAYGKYGMILLPKLHNGGIYYDQMIRLFVSSKSPRKKDLDSADQHIDLWPWERQKALATWVKEKGFDLERLKEDHRERDMFNMRFFLDLQESLPIWGEKQFKGKVQGRLF